MSQDERPLYGELVNPFNAENKVGMHGERITRAEQLRTTIKIAAYVLAENADSFPATSWMIGLRLK